MPETKSQNASRPGRHHLGILGEIKSVHPGEIIGIGRIHQCKEASTIRRVNAINCLNPAINDKEVGWFLEVVMQYQDWERIGAELKEILPNEKDECRVAANRQKIMPSEPAILDQIAKALRDDILFGS
jgi:hypothetical protein